eukprot:14510_1
MNRRNKSGRRSKSSRPKRFNDISSIDHVACPVSPISPAHERPRFAPPPRPEPRPIHPQRRTPQKHVSFGEETPVRSRREPVSSTASHFGSVRRNLFPRSSHRMPTETQSLHNLELSSFSSDSESMSSMVPRRKSEKSWRARPDFARTHARSKPRAHALTKPHAPVLATERRARRAPQNWMAPTVTTESKARLRARRKRLDNINAPPISRLGVHQARMEVVTSRKATQALGNKLKVNERKLRDIAQREARMHELTADLRARLKESQQRAASLEEERDEMGGLVEKMKTKVSRMRRQTSVSELELKQRLIQNSEISQNLSTQSSAYFDLVTLCSTLDSRLTDTMHSHAHTVARIRTHCDRALGRTNEQDATGRLVKSCIATGGIMDKSCSSRSILSGGRGKHEKAIHVNSESQEPVSIAAKQTREPEKSMSPLPSPDKTTAKSVSDSISALIDTIRKESDASPSRSQRRRNREERGDLNDDQLDALYERVLGRSALKVADL